MEPKLFRTLYAYTDWANGVVLDLSATLSPTDYARDFGHAWGSVRGTLAHTYGADWVWFRRWQGESPPALPPEADFSGVDELRRVWQPLMAERRAFIEGLSADDLARVVAYQTTQGTPHSEPLWQLLLHVANHSTDHRSQVSTLLTNLGHPPPPLDLIAYVRANP